MIRRKSSQINDNEIYWMRYCPKANIFIYGVGKFFLFYIFFWLFRSFFPRFFFFGFIYNHIIVSTVGVILCTEKIEEYNLLVWKDMCVCVCNVCEGISFCQHQTQVKDKTNNSFSL